MEEVRNDMELTFLTRVALFYDGMMDSIGANLNTAWPIIAIIMFLFFTWIITRK